MFNHRYDTMFTRVRPHRIYEEECSDSDNEEKPEPTRREKIVALLGKRHQLYNYVGKNRKTIIMSVIFTYLLVWLSFEYLKKDRAINQIHQPLKIISQEEWNENYAPPQESLPSFVAQKVVVLQTDTRGCDNIESCRQILMVMQGNACQYNLKYSFLIASNGDVYEALGWREPSPIFAQHKAMVVGFIGNFAKDTLTAAQVLQADRLFKESLIRGHLDHDYTIVAKITKDIDVPIFMFKSLRTLPRYDVRMSDTYNIED